MNGHSNAVLNLEATQLLVRTALDAIKAAVEAKLYTWPAGTNFTDRRTLTQDASGGDVAVRVTPATAAAADEFIVMGGIVTNGDVAARTGGAFIRTAAGNNLVYLAFVNLTAGLTITFPHTAGDSDAWQGSVPLVVGGTNRLEMRVDGLTALEDATFACYIRCRGANPTVTEVIS